MNMKIIPVIVIAIVVIAAGFAFSPVEQVTTVDQKILDNICVIEGFGEGAFFDGEACLNPDE